jgi:hypothetical protein
MLTCPVELRLNDNSLSGEIPDEINGLTSLKVLELENNDLTGDLPNDVCSFSDLNTLSLDCEVGGCRCCDGCSDKSPTATPPPAPTSTTPPAPTATTFPPFSPTIQTSASPTGCVDAVSVFSTCFLPGDEIVVSLSNCDPESDDWVGLYPSTEDDLENLGNPEIWSWACGSQNCRSAVADGSLALNEDLAGNGDWPLDEGTYMIIMARNTQQPYTAYAVSADFRVSKRC